MCPIFSKAQNETNFWFFGNNAGLDFSSGSPIAISGGQVNNEEGSSAASDPITGALLFYSDGKKVWDASHTPMPNGTGLLGGFSSTMAALIVPKPGSNTLFYLFTTDQYQSAGANGFRYNIVDMSANGGMGDVISKNNLLFAPCAEINHAVKHANCVDYWIISQDAIGNNYNVYLLDSSGLSTTPVVSSIGFSSTEAGWGTGKFSPNGKKFAMAHGDWNYDNILQLFDFNLLTGKLSNALTLSTEETWYGISFSPDNSKLYAGGANYAATKIFQWDLSSEINSTILSSKIFIADNLVFTQFLIGKDSKIYVSKYMQSSLGVITNPNISGTACNYISSVIPLSSPVRYGLPAFPENYFNQSPPGTTIFEGYDTTIAWGASAMLFSNGTGNITWSPSTYLSCSYCPNPISTPTETTEYIYSDDNNGYGCPILKRITVNVEYKPEIPNVFTANDDGVNDFFFIKNLPPQSKLQIYNRWGNLMLDTDDYQNNWKIDVDGVYYYVLLVHDKGYRGFVQVIGNN
ncbi:MAG: hypothetical protein A3K10_17485 [Bacteroidetes bacterium RIFCSPLOWO2_12_FULL_31_6]|nr:MAG: hypothetical protein A3K10_17485 [Bacteroidetes bacterium RIFCSPLOWO2_12_FULL_31_6]